MKKIVAGTLLEKDEKFLLIKQNKGKDKDRWWIPAGGVEEGEYIEDAAIREAYEESGYNVKLLNIICIYNKLIDDVNPLVGIIFKAQIESGDLNYNPDEIADAKWFTYDEIMDMKDQLRSKEALLKSLENHINGNEISLDNIVRVI